MTPERRSKTLKATALWPLVGSPWWLLWRVNSRMHCEWKGDALTGRKFLHLILTIDHLLLLLPLETYSIIAGCLRKGLALQRASSTPRPLFLLHHYRDHRTAVAADLAGINSACRTSRIEAGHKNWKQNLEVGICTQMRWNVLEGPMWMENHISSVLRTGRCTNEADTKAAATETYQIELFALLYCSNDIRLSIECNLSARLHFFSCDWR